MHRHWYLNPEADLETVTANIPLNPLQVKGKGRLKETTSYKKGHGKASTKRLASVF